MDPKITEEIKEQEDALDQSIALNKITVMLLDERKKELKKIWVFFSVVCVAFVALFAVFAYTTHKEKQELMAQLNDTRVDFMEYLDSIEYTVTDDYSTDNSKKRYKNCSSHLRKTKIWHPKSLPNLWQIHAKKIGVTTCDGAHTDSCKAARNSSGQYI